MRKIFLLFALFSIGAIAFSQGISVRFIGRINDANYCRLDSVAVTNITRNWTETVVYPDTIIVFGGTVGTNLNIATSQGLGQNIPNPFDCETRVELSVSQRENVRMQLLDVSGKVYAEYNNSLDAGVHTFDISAAAPQTYILNATIGNRSYSIRMVNTGSGCGSSIKYAGISGSIISKQTLDNEFQIGDNMRYIGYTNIGGNILESEPVLQPLRESQDVELAFRSGNIGVLNGHEWVDLGLPSGTKWATCNIGATSPEGYGDYFAWGETTTKTSYDWFTYRYSDGSGSTNTLTKYCYDSDLGYNGFTDNLTTLVASDDAARANWGSGWRMPTRTEMKELLNNCTHIWTTQNGVYGRLFTGPNGNSIFLPAAGLFYYSTLNQASTTGVYWSSLLSTYNSLFACGLSLQPDGYSETAFVGETANRSQGRPVRAVCEGANISVPTVTTGTASSITATGATLSGNVTSDGGATVTARGFLYGTNASNLTQTVQSGSGTGSFTATLTDQTSVTTYYYKVYATNSAGTAYGEVRSFTTAFTTETDSTSYSEPSGYVNGYGYVDLGLPSGTLWATINVGASTPEGYGDYYAWGETEPKETYDWSNYRYCNGSYNTLTKYCNNSMFGNNGFTDNITTLEASDDAATANWGSGWRMPTHTEMSELLNNCNRFWTTQNGVEGCLFTGPNGNSIFLPAAGHRDFSELIGAGSVGDYWSSSRHTDGPYGAWGLDFSSASYSISNYPRYCGQSVRAVCNDSIPTVNTGTASSITATGATLSGNVTSDGGATVTARGFLYGTNASNLTQTAQSGSGTGSFTSALTGLTSGTTYYYKAYATNSAGTAYGEVMSFTTVAINSPSVQTDIATNVTVIGATLSGNVTSDGGATITARGFLYGTNASNLTQTVQSGSGIGSFTSALTGLTPGTTYYYKAYATNSVGTAYGEVRSFTTENLGITTGTLNGYDWVDLGLPSGTRWAICNVGATNPEDYGNYYAWGETTTKTTYKSSNYRYTGNPTTLPSSADAATANWGSGWRMPTFEELNELNDNCTITWTTRNGVNGCFFTGPYGNSIFLPAAGYRYGSGVEGADSQGQYWSSSLDSDDTGGACFLQFRTVNYGMYHKSRYYGLSVRAVCNGDNIGGNTSISEPSVTTGTASSITATGAIISGDVVSDGGATVTARGFLYGTNASNLTQTVQSGIGTDSFTSALTGLTSGTTYYYKAYATNSVGTAYGEVMSFTTETAYSEPTGYVNGYGYVDLGLPSGTKWATCNVGATNPEDYGNYYAWGETTTKTTYNSSTYTYTHSYTDNPSTLPSSADAATANWGSGWRMPTYEELTELRDQCNWGEWTTVNGVYGMLFTGPNGNSIFLPAAGYSNEYGLHEVSSRGYYWSSSLILTSSLRAYYLDFDSDVCYVEDFINRYSGLSVRPVCNQ